MQVRSILQHAWAALQHDLMYKGEKVPTDSVRRRLIALAGLLELADHEFMAVRLAHGDSAGMLDDAHAGGFDVAAVRRWAEDLAGGEGRRRSRALGGGAARGAVRTRRDLGRRGHSALLGDWAGRGAEVAQAVRATRPWATAAYVADLMLRVALGPDYLARRSVTDPEAVSAALARETAELTAALEGPA